MKQALYEATLVDHPTLADVILPSLRTKTQFNRVVLGAKRFGYRRVKFRRVVRTGAYADAPVAPLGLVEAGYQGAYQTDARYR